MFFLINAVLEQVKRGLEDGKHTFSVIDLYKDNFNPVLTYDEMIKRSDLLNNIETQEYQTLIRQAEHLIFIYPIWWFGTGRLAYSFVRSAGREK